MVEVPGVQRALIESIIATVTEEVAALYQGQDMEVARGDLHYLVHEKLEDALDRIGPELQERRELRRSLGRLLHLMVEEKANLNAASRRA